ncbi:MAG TPA: magnesium transporter MgtE, partial [Negativicutes bacterium]
MADQNKKTVAKPLQTKKSSSVIFKVLALLLVLIMLGGIGFAVGIYLKWIDVQGLANSLKLYDYPVIGQYFPKTQTNFETVDLDQQNSIPQNDFAPPSAQSLAPVPAEDKKPVADVEMEKQAKIKQEAEAKRVAKLARLYGEMKPDEAVPILNQLDDTTVLAILNKMEDDQVAKILAAFDANRSA